QKVADLPADVQLIPHRGAVVILGKLEHHAAVVPPGVAVLVLQGVLQLLVQVQKFIDAALLRHVTSPAFLPIPPGGGTNFPDRGPSRRTPAWPGGWCPQTGSQP